MGPVVLLGVLHLDSAGRKSGISCTANAADCSRASRSRRAVPARMKVLQVHRPLPFPPTIKGLSQQCPSPRSKALLPGDCGYLSTECHNFCPAQTECLQTRPLPTLLPFQARHTQECTLLFKLPPSRTDSGGRRGSQSQEQQLLRRGPFAMLQFLLLKH